MDNFNLKEKFVSIYGENGDEIAIFHSPARVNLIGEHIDYNGGLVLPTTMPLYSYVASRRRNDNKLRLRATDLDIEVIADIDKLDSYTHLKWGNYQLGVADEMQKAGFDITGCDMLFHDTVPHGSGLSASAAIEIATVLTLNHFSRRTKPLDMIEAAKIAQRAENNYVGVKCGIMDQFVSANGRDGYALLLNCNTLEYSDIPLNLGEYTIIVTDSNVRHSLGNSAYNERRKVCENSRDIINDKYRKIDFLCDLIPDEIEKVKGLLTAEQNQKVLHVVMENQRVKDCAKALESGDISTVGTLMNQSHASLRDLYKVSCDELDILVHEAQKLDFVAGSRMTGGGFGGCTVTILKSKFVDEFIKIITDSYREQTGIAVKFYY